MENKILENIVSLQIGSAFPDFIYNERIYNGFRVEGFGDKGGISSRGAVRDYFLRNDKTGIRIKISMQGHDISNIVDLPAK